MGGLLRRGGRERALETLAGAGQGGHDGADGDGSDGRNFLIRTAFQFAKNENFTETRWKGFECARQAFSIVSGNRQSFGGDAGLRMQFLVEFRHEFHRAILLQPGITSIAHNLQKPGTRIATVEPAEKAVGTEHGLLGDVFGVGTALQKPARQIEGGVEMRQHELLEARPVLRIQHVRAFPLVRATHGQEPPEGPFYSQSPLGCDQLNKRLVSTEIGNNWRPLVVWTSETRPICGAGSLDSLTRAALQANLAGTGDSE